MLGVAILPADIQDRDGCLPVYEESLAIRRQLAAADPGNAEWTRSLIIANVKLAQVAGDPTTARDYYAEAFTIAQDLAKSGRLAPADAWMVDELRARIAAVEGSLRGKD